MAYYFGVATLNLKATLSMAQAREDFQKVVDEEEPAIVGLQEFTNRRQNFAFGTPGYSLIKFRNNENPIAWRTGALDLLRARDLTISKTAFWRPSEKRFIKVKATEAVFRSHQSNRKLFVLNTHTPSAVQNPRQRRRRRILRQCLNFINEWIKHVRAWGGIPIVLGDFNWDAARDGWPGSPENVLKSVVSQFEKFGTNPGVGTYKHRDIDYIFTYNGVLVDAGIIGDLNTDHRAAWAEIRI